MSLRLGVDLGGSGTTYLTERRPESWKFNENGGS
jgi:hypothetical protein